MKKTLCTLFSVFFLLLFSLPLWAYSSVTVPLEDPIYRQLDKLEAHGLISTRILGQRPYVRAEIARLLAEALQNYPRFKQNYIEETSLRKKARKLSAKIYVDRLLKQLERDYAVELAQIQSPLAPTVQGPLLDKLDLDFVYLDEAPLRLVQDNGLGGLEAVARPLTENREGRHYARGVNEALETQHWLKLGSHVALQLQPRFQVQVARGAESDENAVFLQRASARFTFDKLDLQLGRDSLNWGPAKSGGLVFSNNARPLDFIKLSNVSPFHYPSVLRKMGWQQWTLVVANLGPEFQRSYPWLIAIKNSMRPHPNFELGISHSILLGGEGSGLGLGEGFAEFFGARDTQRPESDRDASLDLNWRIPKLRGAQLYAEFHFADFDSDPGVFFGQDLSYLAGLYFPRLNPSGIVDLRLEYHRLSPRYARHQTYQEGRSLNQNLLGDPLGPQAQSFSVEMNYDMNPQTQVAFSFQYSRRDSDSFKIDRSGASLAQIRRTKDNPAETRYRGEFAWRHRMGPHIVSRVRVGLEQVSNFAFREGLDHFEWMGEAGLTFFWGDRAWVGPKQ